MKSLVIYESMFGNTKQIAEAIAGGLADSAVVSVVDVSDAPSAVPEDVGLLVIGGPTHAFSMSRASTRREAADRGAAATDTAVGIREWLEGLPRQDSRMDFAAFDTRVHMPLLPGAASRAATRIARRLHFRTQEPQSFFVAGYEGPLLDGELDRARTWGRALATTFSDAPTRGA